MRARLSEALDQICLAEGVTRDKLVSVDIISATRSASGMSGPMGSAEPAPIRSPLCCPGAWKDLLGPVPLSERPSLVVNTVEDRLVDRSRSKDPSGPCHKTAGERITRFRDPIQLPSTGGDSEPNPSRFHCLLSPVARAQCQPLGSAAP